MPTAKGITRGVNDIQSLLQRIADNSATTSPSSGAFVDHSATIVAGGTAQQVMAANADRVYLLFENVSDTDMWLNFGANAAAVPPSIKILPNGSYVMENSFVTNQLVSVFCATTGKAYTAKEASSS